MRLGEILREGRMDCMLTIREICLEADIKESTYKAIEAGRIAEPSAQKTLRIMSVLDLDVEDVVGRMSSQ